MISVIRPMPFTDAGSAVERPDGQGNEATGVKPVMMQQCNAPGIQGQSSQTARSKDLVTHYKTELNYRFQKDQMELEKNAVLLEQKRSYEAWHKDMVERYRAYHQLMGCTIYPNQDGDLMFAITNAFNQNVGAKRLLNVRGYSVRRLFCCFPKPVEVLEIAWSSQARKERFFWSLGGSEKNGNVFLRRLKSRGILLLVSGRSEKQAADALFAYSYVSARDQEIPWQQGWGLNAAQEWHFAKPGALTMQEVMKWMN